MAKPKKSLSPMEQMKSNQLCEAKLKKPYTLSAPDIYTENPDDADANWVEFGASMYCRTGTVLTFDFGYWLMPSSFIQENLNEGLEVHYDIPGKKIHSRHTTGTFITSIHSISNLVYETTVNLKRD
jgi:hypothetical protein